MEDFTYDISQLSTEENGILTSLFSEMEVFDAKSLMEHNKAPGRMGFWPSFIELFERPSRVT
jgi:hypothetical protein